MNTTKIILSSIVVMLLMLISACNPPLPSESVAVKDMQRSLAIRDYGEKIDIHQQGDGKIIDGYGAKINDTDIILAALKLPVGFY